MLLKRNQILMLGAAINKIKQSNIKSSIQAKYKILKIEALIKEEIEISNKLVNELIYNYAELDENGQVIMNDDGAVKVKEDSKEILQKELNNFYDIAVIIPDYKFDISELEIFELNWNDLEAFLPFVK